MYNNLSLESKFSKVVDAYIFTELYKRQAIKSKSFNFSNNSNDIRSKLMYIIKSLVVRIIKENELQNLLTNTSFCRDSLYISYNLSHYNLQHQICIQYAKRVMLQNNTSQVSNNGLTFSINDICNLFQNRHGANLKNIKNELDEIINNIFFIQNAVLEIGKFFKEVKDAPVVDVLNLKHCQYLLSRLGFVRNVETLNITKQSLELLMAHEDNEIIFNLPIPCPNVNFDNIMNVDTQAVCNAIVDFIKDMHSTYILKEKSKTEEVPETLVAAPVEDENPNIKWVTIGGERIAINIISL